MKCPICESEKCVDFVVDLKICGECTHIFKTEPKVQEHHFSELHKLINPIEAIRMICEQVKDDEILDFIFPSMMFYGLEVQPSKFYKNKYNHYFNQQSLMIFVNRCGLEIIEQRNRWSGNICETHLKTKKEKR